MIGIYKITNPLGEVYVGQSRKIQRRKNEHFSNKECKHFKLKESFLRYGKEKHIFEVIEECSIKLLNERERYWQEYYNVLNIGLNCILTKTNDKYAILCKDSINRIKNKNKGRKQSEIEKTKRLGLNTKIIIDINTGVFYKDAKEVSDLYNINKSTLVSWLNTTKKNKSQFRYALDNGIYNKY
ncbi:grpIintron_endo, group I intron endonuclease [uncultured Caudovirales phage]|uniref:GrpIintron_endo, group I intron endonuclease n=1 Tax=uncultured Caudovirales phage TaxID=2100421 RepID=A0A6J5N7K9_9CAUD|nr:grpIintron_endo, group I intron endonuclease [uncultured Caudovirales phage]CAB4151709.1 grpIintron_endo, group I intron endonuclease [uncultured Caudovirales phage]